MVTTRRTPSKAATAQLAAVSQRRKVSSRAQASPSTTADESDVVPDSEDERIAANVTPTKKRQRTSPKAESEQVMSPIHIFVTPTKAAALCSVSHLPTPPITPTVCLDQPDAFTPASCSSSSNVYARARSLLRLSAPSEADSKLIGRDIEKAQIENFLARNLPNLYSPCNECSASAPINKALYVSGSPGTGKTALLTSVLSKIVHADQTVKVAYINCTTLQNANDVWERLAEDLSLTRTHAKKGKGKQPAWEEGSFQESMLDDSMPKCLVVLDEVDHLISQQSTPNILSSLFSLAAEQDSRLVLIGIANALDLTQRHLAHLQYAGSSKNARHDQPELLHFRPFSSTEMVAIVKSRLAPLHGRGDNSSLPLPIIMPPALELAAKKVSAVSGDLRIFLSLIRKAVELFEQEQRKLSAANEESESTSPTLKRRKITAAAGQTSPKKEDSLAHYDATNAPKLTPAHILKATRLISLATSSSASTTSQGTTSLSAAGTASNGLLEAKITDINLQGRIALAAFIIAVERVQTRPFEATSAPAIDAQTRPADLYSLYRSLLDKHDVLHPVSSSEFGDLLSGLHTRGLVGFQREHGKTTSPRNGKSPSGRTGSPATLAPPTLMRRSSSSSSTGSGRSRSPSPSANQAPIVLLYSSMDLAQVLRKTKPAEAASICSAMLAKEEKRLRRVKMAWERAEAEQRERRDAPTAGFHGDGLENVDVALVGKRDRRGTDHDEDDDLRNAENHENIPSKTADDDDDPFI